MAVFEGHTKILAPDLGIGWQTALNLTVRFSPIASSAKLDRDWNAASVDLADPMFRLYRITLSSGADDMRPPALADKWPGTAFSLVPPGELSLVIPTGGTTAVFERTIHEARALTLGFEDIPFTFSGKTITLSSAATEPVRVFARLQYEVMVWEPWDITFNEADAQYSWQLVTEEVGGF